MLDDRGARMRSCLVRQRRAGRRAARDRPHALARGGRRCSRRRRQRLGELGGRLPRALAARAAHARADSERGRAAASRRTWSNSASSVPTEQLAALWRLAGLAHPERPLQRGFVRVTDRDRGRRILHAGDARAAAACSACASPTGRSKRRSMARRHGLSGPRQDRIDRPGRGRRRRRSPGCSTNRTRCVDADDRTRARGADPLYGGHIPAAVGTATMSAAPKPARRSRSTNCATGASSGRKPMSTPPPAWPPNDGPRKRGAAPLSAGHTMQFSLWQRCHSALTKAARTPSRRWTERPLLKLNQLHVGVDCAREPEASPKMAPRFGRLK